MLPLLILSALPAFAESTANEWELLIQEVNSLYQQGQYDGAIVVAGNALEVAMGNVGPDHPEVATSLNILGLLYKLKGQYAEAEPFFKRALAMKEKVFGPNHPALGTSLENLAELYEATGRQVEAEIIAERAASLRPLHEPQG